MYALDAEDESNLRCLIHGGCHDLDEVKESFIESYLDPSELSDEDVEALTDLVERRYADKLAEEQSWQGPVLFEVLDQAFTEINAHDGVVAMHDAGFTRDDGIDEVAQECRARGGSAAGVLGGVFYTSQDRDTAIEAGILRLAYFALGRDAETCDARIAVIMPKIMQRLQAAGLPATWDGNQESTIEITPVVWRKRSPAIADDADAGEQEDEPVRRSLFSRMFKR